MGLCIVVDLSTRIGVQRDVVGDGVSRPVVLDNPHLRPSQIGG